LSGPAKTPTNVLKMRGSPLAGNRSNEPVADRRRPRRPSWLSKDAKTIWRRIVPQLEAMGVLAICDRNALARYCDLVERYIRLSSTPCEGQLTLLLKMTPVLIRLEREFGLTPSARAGLSVPAVNPRENRGKGIERHFDGA